MIFNTDMKRVLSNISINERIIRNDYPIWKKENQAGESYYGVGNFCGLDRIPIKGNVDLLYLEWDGNEVYLSNRNNIMELINQSLDIVASWVNQMEKEYSKVPFDIFLSVADGDGQDINPSVTLRFWAVRNQKHCINPTKEELEKFSQAVLIKQVNYK